MPNLDYLIHLPLLRIEDEILPFGAGQLYRMPFAKYDEISFGAFSEQQQRYEATAPVFLSLSVPVSEDGLERRIDEVQGLIELKVPSSHSEMLGQLGLEFVNWVHREFGTPAWTALLLVAPAAAFAPPRWSQTFVGIDGGFTMQLASRPAVGARIQGQADHEYLFLPDAPSDRLANADVARAVELVDFVRALERVPDLHAALATLRATGLPVLSRQDRLTIAVQALESLLLPDVQTMLKRTFARRVAALLASDADAAERLAALAANLYSLRSESVHGNALPDDTAALEDSHAEQLLAAAIRAVGTRVLAGQALDAVRVELDRGYAALPARLGFGIPSRPIGRASEHRLARRTPSDVFVITSSMVAEEGRVCCWSPLLGLTTEGLEERGAMLLGDPPVPVLLPLSPKELWDLEERDIRRDFLMEFVQRGHPMAVLVTVPQNEGLANAAASTPWLERLRDLGVVTLRLAGFDQFHDPELFGSVVFEGTRRFRWPTALRQTVAEKLRHVATQCVGPADGPRLADLWREMWRYETGGRARAIEYILGLFRRSFDRDFLDVEQRAVILVGLFEAMLGRFRPTGDPVQLEDLLEALLGRDQDVTWFCAEGRKFRNRVAHGELKSDEPVEVLESLSRLASRVVLELITTWNLAQGAARRDRPSDLLIQRATAQLRAC